MNVTLKGKQYTVIIRDDGTADIRTSWEGYNVADRDTARALPVYRSCYVSPSGRLGKAVLKAANISIDPDSGRIITTEG
jgi:hypothetical protein